MHSIGDLIFLPVHLMPYCVTVRVVAVNADWIYTRIVDSRDERDIGELHLMQRR